MAAPELHVPPARPRAQRELGDALPLARLLPRPVVYAMAGGGAHGAVQWGSLQALHETDVRPDSIIGTSAGALSGAVYCEDPLCGLSRLAYVWAQLDVKFVVGENWLSRLANARQVALTENATERQTLQSLLTARAFADLELPFAAVATDLGTGRPVVLDSGELVPALLASSAIPGLLPPVSIDGRFLVDGLASANLPAMPAVERGAGSVVVLDTGGRAPAEPGTSARKVLSRLVLTLSESQRRDQLRDAAHRVPVILLPTPGNLGGTLDFRDTMESASTSYALARQFLIDLVTTRSQPLPPGLYARPDARGIGDSLPQVLRPVTP